jgi:hypothetical protein
MHECHTRAKLSDPVAKAFDSLAAFCDAVLEFQKAVILAFDGTYVSTIAIAGLGMPYGIFVLGDGTRLFSSDNSIKVQITPSGRLDTIAGVHFDNLALEGLKDGQGISARFHHQLLVGGQDGQCGGGGLRKQRR